MSQLQKVGVRDYVNEQTQMSCLGELESILTPRSAPFDEDRLVQRVNLAQIRANEDDLMYSSPLVEGETGTGWNGLLITPYYGAVGKVVPSHWMVRGVYQNSTDVAKYRLKLYADGNCIGYSPIYTLTNAARATSDELYYYGDNVYPSEVQVYQNVWGVNGIGIMQTQAAAGGVDIWVLPIGNLDMYFIATP